MQKHSQLFKNLKALEDASFPKACDRCGMHFSNEADYIEKTVPYQKSSGLTESIDGDGQTFIKLIRQCHCGSPIVDHFDNRRDMSAQGEIRRRAFNKVIDNLIQKGLTHEKARQELLNYMQNKKSPLLEQLGIFKG